MNRNRYEILPCGLAVVYLMGGGREHATLIDAEDLPKVLVFPGKWYAQRRTWSWYAAATAHIGGRKITVRLHRYLTDAPEDMEVDHTDHDGLNNTRRNLRLVSPEENKANQRPWGEGRDYGYRWYESAIEEDTEPLPF